MKTDNSKYIFKFLSLVLHKISIYRKRSLFAISGIIIGIAAVTTLTSLGYSSQKALEEELKKLGTNILVVESSQSMRGQSRQTIPENSLNIEDTFLIQSEIIGVSSVAPALFQTGNISNGDFEISTDIFATNNKFLEILEFIPLSDRFFSQEEIDDGKNVVLLGHTIAKLLFGDEDPSGSIVKIKSVEFEVIGLLREKGLDANGEDQDEIVVVPMITAYESLDAKNMLTHIFVEVERPESIPLIKEKIHEVLLKARDLTSEDTNLFTILDQTRLLEARSDILGSIQNLVNVLALVTLAAGSIGIFAVLLISIRENTWEIGLHRAMGARKSDILKQFLLESSVLGGFGGIGGILFGILSPFVITAVFSMTFAIDWLAMITALVVSILIGMLSGIYPALYASRLDPVTALRASCY